MVIASSAATARKTRRSNARCGAADATRPVERALALPKAGAGTKLPDCPREYPDGEVASLDPCRENAFNPFPSVIGSGFADPLQPCPFMTFARPSSFLVATLVRDVRVGKAGELAKGMAASRSVRMAPNPSERATYVIGKRAGKFRRGKLVGHAKSRN
jgi:hypothetical protein